MLDEAASGQRQRTITMGSKGRVPEAEIRPKADSQGNRTVPPQTTLYERGVRRRGRNVRLQN